MQPQRPWMVGVFAFFAAGLLAGWWTADGRPDRGRESWAEHLSAASPLGQGAEMVPGPPTESPEARQRELLETLLEQAEGDSQADLVRLLGRFSRDPQEVAGVIIDAMSDAELVASLSSFTDISPEKLKSSSDPKALAHRLVDLAMESLLQIPNSEGSAIQGVYFSEGLVENPLQEASTRFAGEERILANFPMGDYRGKEIFVKWTRVDDPKIMLFNHYPIRPERDFNHVWLRPDEGWDPGEYQVNFYSADDSLVPIAAGRYWIEPNP